MATATDKPVTIEDLLAMPDDGMDREIIRGEFRESPMNRRNPWHSKTMGALAHVLLEWLGRQPQPRGDILVGDASFRLRKAPESSVGIDIAYISAELKATIARGASFIEGVPILAIEILSPSDPQIAITEKVELYLETGVKLVWIVDPALRIVTVFSPDAEAALFNRTQVLSGDPYLPGFQVDVARIFGS